VAPGALDQPAAGDMGLLHFDDNHVSIRRTAGNDDVGERALGVVIVFCSCSVHGVHQN